MGAYQLPPIVNLWVARVNTIGPGKARRAYWSVPPHGRVSVSKVL